MCDHSVVTANKTKQKKPLKKSHLNHFGSVKTKLLSKRYFQVKSQSTVVYYTVLYTMFSSNLVTILQCMLTAV